METVDILNLSDFVNHNYYVNISLQGRMKVVHLDEFDSCMLLSIGWKISQVIPIEKKFSLFLPLLVFFENNWEQNGWTCDSNLNFDQIGVYLWLSDPLLVWIYIQDLNRTFEKITFWMQLCCYNIEFQCWIKSTIFFPNCVFGINKFSQSMERNRGIHISGCLFDLPFMCKTS